MPARNSLCRFIFRPFDKSLFQIDAQSRWNTATAITACDHFACFALVRRFDSALQQLIEQYLRSRPQLGKLTFLPQEMQTNVTGLPPL